MQANLQSLFIRRNERPDHGYESGVTTVVEPAQRQRLRAGASKNVIFNKEIEMVASVVLITGAPTGIGRAAAISFAKADSRVVVSGRKEDTGKALADEFRSLGAVAEFIQADVRREEDIRRLV